MLTNKNLYCIMRSTYQPNNSKILNSVDIAHISGVISSVLVGTNHFILQNKRDLAGLGSTLSKLAVLGEKERDPAT